MDIWYTQGFIAGLDMTPNLEHDRSHSSKKKKKKKSEKEIQDTLRKKTSTVKYSLKKPESLNIP